MDEDKGSVELTTEYEPDDTPYVEFDISVSPSDPSLELLASKLRDNDIIIPFYQRRYVWSIQQASKLIESFLMGLPVPQVFLYVNDQDQLEIIDGQQRILSVSYFFEGFFGEEDRQGRRQVFTLKGLSERSEYNGKTFSQLDARDQRRLRQSTLRAIHIKQLRPKSGNESVFHIFERLNTGGTSLSPQEIRSAVYRGAIVSGLASLNENADWQSILGLRKPDRNQKDIELVLRLFALFEEWQTYEKPMVRFLNRTMNDNRNFDSLRASRFRNKFPTVMALINSSLQRPFRPKGTINTAVLEAVVTTLLECADLNKNNLRRDYERLLADAKFSETIFGSTTDTMVLRRRIQRAKEILAGAKT